MGADKKIEIKSFRDFKSGKAENKNLLSIQDKSV